ncbi:hypothetical protein [uncultured Cohaesibacter sp.]|uniref:hypothetical protein n=1 Tax=uncultured Cohaesibacter sp. TaxID=1002546 RepID=UPI00292EAAEB|nr:hypothetical protein [uncultured Cohaesibacter sp.]
MEIETTCFGVEGILSFRGFSEPQLACLSFCILCRELSADFFEIILKIMWDFGKHGQNFKTGFSKRERAANCSPMPCIA